MTLGQSTDTTAEEERTTTTILTGGGVADTRTTVGAPASSGAFHARHGSVNVSVRSPTAATETEAPLLAGGMQGFRFRFAKFFAQVRNDRNSRNSDEISFLQVKQSRSNLNKFWLKSPKFFENFGRNFGRNSGRNFIRPAVRQELSAGPSAASPSLPPRCSASCQGRPTTGPPLASCFARFLVALLLDPSDIHGWNWNESISTSACLAKTGLKFVNAKWKLNYPRELWRKRPCWRRGAGGGR